MLRQRPNERSSPLGERLDRVREYDSPDKLKGVPIQIMLSVLVSGVKPMAVARSRSSRSVT